ncbi:MAG: LpqN/LpqT family lipoprotein [Actinomycetia bacterium]|nr:LpqN/LpqT family lipoprotein [Actinomycetes bacterium]
MTTTPAVRNPHRRGWGYRLTVSGMLVFAAAGCANPTNPSSVDESPTVEAPNTAAGCQTVNVPLVDIPPQSGGATTMQIPQPPGWEISPIDESEHERLRFVQTNQDLAANQYAPTSAVTLGSYPGEWPAQELFDEANSELSRSGFAGEIQSSAATVCGQPAEISDYTMTLDGVSTPLFAKALMAVTTSGNETHIAVLTVTTTEPDNPIYQRDSQTILDGFVFLPSDSQ